jgi:hypothetical protein
MREGRFNIFVSEKILSFLHLIFQNLTFRPFKIANLMSLGLENALLLESILTTLLNILGTRVFNFSKRCLGAAKKQLILFN